jgi:predicted peroxiredoxin
MSESPDQDLPAPGLVIVLSTGSPEAAQLGFRYGATAAAMDIAVEVHAVSAGAVRLLLRDVCGAALVAQIRQATEQGASVFVCPVALAESGHRIEELVDAVSGVRGAASLIGAGFAAGARFMSF